MADALDRRTFLGAAASGLLVSCGRGGSPEPSAAKTLSDVLHLDALAQGELVRRREVRSLELVEAVIQRIEALNPQLNAVVTKMYDLARAAAPAEPHQGPFAGVPFLLKDLGPAYAGVRLTAGSKALSNNIPDFDSELVVRQRRAGLITVGKTNTPEFGLTATTEPHLFGPAHNPWNLDLTAGGSSGGSAAAVAARIVPMAHGNDGGGSIRIPASCCGIFGLKPTRGRNPLGPRRSDVNGLGADHALSVTVRDSAALLDATSGPYAGDPFYAPPPSRPFLHEVSTPPGRLRIAFSTQYLDGRRVHGDCVAAVESTAKLLEGLGHQVEQEAPQIDFERFSRAFAVLWWSGLASNIQGMFPGATPQPDNFEPLTWQVYLRGREIPAADYIRAAGYLQSVTRAVAQFLTAYDLWLSPTLGTPPVKLGVLHPGPQVLNPNIEEVTAKLWDFVPCTCLANVIGHPAMSVPLHWNSEGLPIGVHFLGRFGEEGTLFRLAGQLEQARPWRNRRPPISS